MLVKFKDRTLYIDSYKISDLMKAKYSEHAEFTMALPNGAFIDFRKGGFGRIILATVLTRLIIPMLQGGFALHGKEPPQKPKHGDLLDYTANCYADLFAISTDKLVIEIEEQPYMSEMTELKSISVTKEESIQEVVERISEAS